jgi:hypothetical protein
MRTTVFAVVLLLPETVRAIFDNMCASAHSTTVSNHLLDHVAILSSLTFHPPPKNISVPSSDQKTLQLIEDV